MQCDSSLQATGQIELAMHRELAMHCAVLKVWSRSTAMLYMMPSSILTSFIRTLVYHHIFFSLLIFPFPFSMSESDSVMPLYTGLIHPCHIHRTTHRQTNSRRFLFGSIYSWGRRQESHCVVRNLDLLRRETVGDAYLWVCMRKGLIHCIFLDKETLCTVRAPL